MSLSGVPPLLHQLAGRVQQPTANMASNDEEDDEQMSDCDDMPYIKCEAVYGEGGDDDDDMSALPFVSTEMREDEDECDSDKMKFGMKAPEVGAYVKCSVPSCHSYFEVGNPKYEGFSHFKFPEDPNMRRRWIGIIGQKDDWKPEGAMICSNHFAESSFVTLLEHVAETGQLMPKRSLKAGAIPTMNLDIPKNNWNAQRVLQPPNNGVQAAPAAPVVRPAAPPSVHPATPIRSPYCQARAITLTKNGKRRGRPPKNRPPDDYSPSVPQMVATPSIPSPVQVEATPNSSAPTATSTPVSASFTSQANGSTHSVTVSAVSPAQPTNLFAQSQLSPFHLLGMGRRKRGRPRKEVSCLYPGFDARDIAFLQNNHQSDESLRRIAEGAAEAAFGWSHTNNWRRNNVPMKRRKILPAMGPGQQRQHRVEQLECTIDPINFLQLQHQEGGSGSSTNIDRDLSHLKSLVSSVGDLSAKSLGELCRVVEGTLERLRKSDAAARMKKEMEAVKNVTKDMKAEVDVKLPPSLSIKAVGPKTSTHSSSTIEEEPIPALTITIKREGKLVNGDALPLKVEDIKREPLDIKVEPEDVKPETKVEQESDSEKEGIEEGPAEEEEDLPEGEDEELPDREEGAAADANDDDKEDTAAESDDQEDDDQEGHESDADENDEANQNGDELNQNCHSVPTENGKATSESGSDSGDTETDNS